jgi:hypothetical protein
VPFSVVLPCALALPASTYPGGRRIVRTLRRTSPLRLAHTVVPEQPAWTCSLPLEPLIPDPGLPT